MRLSRIEASNKLPSPSALGRWSRSGRDLRCWSVSLGSVGCGQDMNTSRMCCGIHITEVGVGGSSALANLVRTLSSINVRLQSKARVQNGARLQCLN